MKRLLHRKALLILLTLFVASGHATALEASLRYVNTMQNESAIFCEPSLTCPEGNWTLPTFTTKAPLFFLIALGDETRLCVLDGDADTGRYTRCYFDFNGNGDLTEDAPIATSSPGDAGIVVLKGEKVDCFSPIETEIKLTGQQTTYAFTCSVRYYDSLPDSPSQDDIDGLIEVSLLSHCAYQGVLTLEGTTYQLAFRDTTVNGRFDDLCTPPKRERFDPFEPLYPPEAGDSCAISTEKLLPTDWMFYGKQWYIGGQLYDVVLDIPATTLRLTPVTDETVPLHLAAPVNRLNLIAETYKDGIILIEPGAAPKLRPATYALLDYQWRQQDPQGDTWLLTAQASLDTHPIKLSAKQGGKAAFGEPFAPIVYVPAWSIENVLENDMDEADVTFTVVGAAQEVVTNLERIAGKKTQIPLSQVKANRPSEPRYIITDPAGSIVARGAFEYG